MKSWDRLGMFIAITGVWALILALSPVSAGENEGLKKVSLQLQWKHQFEFAGFYAAKEKGFYREAGLNVTFREYSHGMNYVE
ncbi:MAG: ABC transporter substrate-binding protein, partial [Gammaproteobacteria bacterium]|nr:ABC transporter substrate-binding protein [Gammaproteobacteria bacterium]